MKNISYPVPFISQFSRDLPEEWHWRACGIAVLKMLIEYWRLQDKNLQSPLILELLKVGVETKAYIPGVGWSHKGLVDLAQKYGYRGFNEDKSNLPLNGAFSPLRAILKEQPVIISVWKNFNLMEKGGHLVVLNEISDNMAVVTDPKELDAERGVKKINIDNFLKGWKQRYVVIQPAM